MLDERTKEDIIKANNNFNTVFPNSPIPFAEMLEKFNKSEFAVPDAYLAPLYDDKAYKDFMSFSRTEIQEAKSKMWQPSIAERNEARRKQLKNRPFFSPDR